MTISVLYGLGLFLLIHSAFYIIEQIHYRWCASPGAYGFFQSMLTNGSGMCSQLRKVSNMASSASSNLIYLFTSFIGGWVANTLKKSNPSLQRSETRVGEKMNVDSDIKEQQ